MSTPATPELINFQGRPAVRLEAPDGARATVLLHGGHVVSWRPAGGDERLYLSPRAVHAPGQAVRGGVPVVFPQFERRGPLPRHGFARTRDWQLVRAEVGAADAMAVLRLADDAETRAFWPHPFALELTVNVSGTRLDLELEAVHTGEAGSAPWSFTAALHTYLALDEVELARVQGLQGLRYIDSARGGEGLERGEELRFDGEVDRIYLGAHAPLLLREPQRALAVEQLQFPDTVVWNPGAEKAAAIADLPEGGFRHFVCLEAGVIGEPVTLEPGGSWWGRQTLLAG
ncbi:D-hexose-6-phosphate mutarotase [Caldimonas tepidiphila]|uniref:D-hexose-6-phosphate mutarotase n=1 Tax=Caldimonas tepidiphila TaxID=2315841 RepID=UPI000E5AAEB4|nr:D-hexose-6-phosphate mutarotase [Caldimonas tepidiphila]